MKLGRLENRVRGSWSVLQAACRSTGKGLSRLDPRVVRFKKPRRFPKWVMTIQVVLVLLAIGVAAAAAALPRGESVENKAIKETAIERGYKETEPRPGELFETSKIESKEPEVTPVKRDSEFYDPLYVFLDADVEGVSAYPLASPPGIVIDLLGTPEPILEPEKLVGEDERIRVVKRRATASGIRYVIGLTTPIKRIETIKEGGVVMVFPKS